MNKLSLMLIPILLGSSSFAFASQVTLYGLLDLGVNYEHKSLSYKKLPHKNKITNILQMKGSQFSGSRVGIKGQEDLGAGNKVGFVLEAGLNMDDGSSSMGANSAFGRESQIYYESDYGRIALGRVCSLGSIYGSYGIFHPIADNFWGGWSTYGGTTTRLSQSYGRMDNTITLVSPNLSGLKLYAQYSFNVNGEEHEKSSENNRYTAIGATFKLGALQLVAVADYTKQADFKYQNFKRNLDDSYTLKFGGNYDFKKFKLFAAAQYVAHSQWFLGVNNYFLSGISGLNPNLVSQKIAEAQGFIGGSYLLGTDIPFYHGTLKFQFQYSHAKTASTYLSSAYGSNVRMKLDSGVLSVGYLYPFSKRTMLYALAGTSLAKYKFKNSSETGRLKDKTTTVLASLVHMF